MQSRLSHVKEVHRVFLRSCAWKLFHPEFLNEKRNVGLQGLKSDPESFILPKVMNIFQTTAHFQMVTINQSSAGAAKNVHTAVLEYL